MHEPSVSDYDKFAYPPAVYPQTHPDCLATVATLYGLRPERVERARVLELGCNDGNNLISMACTLPDSEFHGVDLAVEPIRRGQEVIAALDLKNVSLRQMNILDMPADIGAFDYIIAHGFYSWVPEVVREKILGICREHLAENGVAYISYNAYPGCHLRDLTRGMMLFHARQFSEPSDQVRQGRALVKFLAECQTEPGLWQHLLKSQLERLEMRGDSNLFHDDFSPVCRPFYFHEFVEAAARHQLEFFAEADLRDTRPDGLTEEGRRVLRQMEQMNRVAYEQYLDFVVGRAFRRTLLCHQGCGVDRGMKAERVCNLFMAADVAAVNPGANVAVPGAEDFKRGETVIAASQPVFKSALMVLGEVWPHRVPFSELLSKARHRAGRSEASRPPALESDQRDLADFLLCCSAVGLVDLHSYPSNFVTHVSERPEASPLVRWQIRQEAAVSSLRHMQLNIEDALGREVLRLVDGTRDRAALLKELGGKVKAGSIPICIDGKPIAELPKALDLLAGQLELSLTNLAKVGLFVG